LTAIKFWARDKFKVTAALKKKANPTRIPIEQKESYRWLETVRQSTARLRPDRCVPIGDRESDIVELFCTAEGAVKLSQESVGFHCNLQWASSKRQRLAQISRK
jgi:hypothetical protein